MMPVHPARGLSVALAAVITPSSYVPLHHVFVRRFTLNMEDEAVHAVREHNWQTHSEATQQHAHIEVEVALGEDAALVILRDSALQALGMMIRVTFPDGSLVSGLYAVSQYEVFAEEGDILRIAFTAKSRDALTLSLGG